MSIYGGAADDILGEDCLNEAVIDENLPSEADEEGDEEKRVNIEPKKRLVRNPRPRLTIETLIGPRGIHTIEKYFKNIEFHGKGHEKKDLDEVMRRLQHWAHRMYPNYKFEDTLINIERLGKKKQLQHHLSRYRQGLLEENAEDPESGGRQEQTTSQDEPFDEFDALLGEQIAISKLASRTPSHYGDTSDVSSMPNTPKFTAGNAAASTPHFSRDTEKVEAPTRAQVAPPSKLSAEQMARVAENRRLAQERLKAKREAVNKVE